MASDQEDEPSTDGCIYHINHLMLTLILWISLGFLNPDTANSIKHFLAIMGTTWVAAVLLLPFRIDLLKKD